MNTAVKHVQNSLLTVRTCHRREGDVPYPLHYSRALQNYDNWSRHFFSQHVKNGLTLHEFPEPPLHVLDLGCGAGGWIVEAATQWKDTRFVGLDLPQVSSLQPSAVHSSPVYDKVAPRIRWVHTNFLEGLPFSQEEFDFVRVVGIGLGVPEDEWQYVFEEIGRVLKPGGVVEVVEDDLIFPCSLKPRQQPTSYPRFKPSTSPLTPLSLESINTIITQPNSESTTSPPGSIPFPRKQSSSPVQPRLHRKSSSASILSHSDYDQDGPDADRRDHQKLKAAFESMLASRFLSPRTLSVLPFYLQSIFDDIWSYPTLHIPLPPNTNPYDDDAPDLDWQTRFDPSTAFTLSATSRVSTDSSSDCSTRPSIYDRRYALLWAPMHLARTVEMIKACKEAIWVEYELLYGNEAELPPVTRTARLKDIRACTSRASIREQFDKVWWNWENDMTDRMRLRTLTEQSWDGPAPPGDKPDWQIWRKRVAAQDVIDDTRPQEAVCRSIRGFVGFKRTSR